MGEYVARIWPCKTSLYTLCFHRLEAHEPVQHSVNAPSVGDKATIKCRLKRPCLSDKAPAALKAAASAVHYAYRNEGRRLECALCRFDTSPACHLLDLEIQ